MPTDQRFFSHGDPVSLKVISELTGALCATDSHDQLISSLASLSSAIDGDVAFLDGGNDVVQTAATACFVQESELARLADKVVPLITRTPRHAHAQLSNALITPHHELEWSENSVDPSAIIGDNVRIAPSAVVGASATIGDRTIIGPGSVIGPGVQIGRDCKIGFNVSVVCALIGNEVTISSGVRIGEAGFGVVQSSQGAFDVPQLGRVILQDGVSIGANSCVDRGALDDTILGERTKIDNLCQIGHNVEFGRNVLMAAFGGISGSVTIGDETILGGRVGIADHVSVGKGAVLAASAGLFKDVKDGEKWGGTPAKPFGLWMRETAWLQKQVKPKRKPKPDA